MGLAAPMKGYRGGIARADRHGSWQRERKNIMKRMGVLLAVGLVAASILSGCIVVPADGYPPRGYYRPYYYPYYPYYYRPYYPGYYRGW